MGLKGIFFIGIFGICSLLALSEPFAGIIAYVVYYNTSPENSWWGAGLAASGVRYSVVITLCLTIGTLLNLKKLAYGPRLLNKQEVLYLSFIALMLVLRLAAPMQGANFKGGALTITDPVDKLLKLAPFLLALTHIVVTPVRYNQFTWLIVACALYLGYECRTTPSSYYTDGRLEGVGPSDARDSNMLAAHLAVLLTFVGIQFLRSGWKGKLVCFLAGGYVANGVVLTRSRGSYLALIAGVISTVVLLPKGKRKRALPFIILGALGAFAIVDKGFTDRMGTLEAGEREDDESAQSRVRFWKAGFRMALDHPLGVGPGNFYSRIGDYLPQDGGRDPHNTYVRCVAELGFLGLFLLLAMIANAFLTLARIRRSISGRLDLEECVWHCLGLQVAMIVYGVAVFFITATYLELFWWLLMLPTSLERVAANALAGGPADQNSNWRLFDRGNLR